MVKIDKYDPTNWIFGSGSNWIFGSGSISLASSKSSSDDRVTVLELKPNTSSDQFSPNGTDVWGQFASVGGQFATVLQRNPQEILIKEDLTDSPIGSPIFDSNGELLAIVVGKNKTTYYFNFILPGGAMRAKLVYSLPSIIAALGSVMK